MATQMELSPHPSLSGISARSLSAVPAGELLHALGSICGALCLRCGAGLRLGWRRHATRRELGRLDARLLRDLGITEERALYELGKWFWQE